MAAESDAPGRKAVTPSAESHLNGERFSETDEEDRQQRLRTRISYRKPVPSPTYEPVPSEDVEIPAAANTNFMSKWRRAQWVTRSVTISALIIRAASSAQAVVATAMVASLLLERHGVKVADAAEFSILRFTNAGHVFALWMFLRNYSRLNNGPTFSISIVLLATTTSILQFASTILLTDVSSGSLILGDTLVSVPIGMKAVREAAPMWDTPYWLMTPYQFPAFLEYKEEPVHQEGVSDTGITVRGFLPLPSQSSWKSLRYYRGSAAFFDTRVVCSRPAVRDLVSYIIFNYTGDVAATNPGSDEGGALGTNHLLCPIDHGPSTGTYASPGALVSRLNPLRRPLDQYEESEGERSGWRVKNPQSYNEEIGPLDGHTYLLWDLKDVSTNCGPSGKCCGPYRMSIAESESDGVWSQFTLKSGGWDFGSVRATLCFDAFGFDRGATDNQYVVPHDFDVTFSQNQDLPDEPIPSPGDGSRNLNTADIRKQLGAVHNHNGLSTGDRGVLPLGIKQIDQQLDSLETSDE
ncbi:hypothetical protein K402DRAFT_404727 [Aulographum hederae CBS 113979]|uniref:Uncharacterized protein n=1 Tax=Aulographum hederae CBS 113979 TaxID=1176131 RepID=A0A6G1GYT4_9PEZI|nr:hypothetical protein K402DRAFT_404727 [Aulographum hederae CBS 113979]